jgi:hypothetical protein
VEGMTIKSTPMLGASALLSIPLWTSAIFSRQQLPIGDLRVEFKFRPFPFFPNVWIIGVREEILAWFFRDGPGYAGDHPLPPEDTSRSNTTTATARRLLTPNTVASCYSLLWRDS